MLVQEISFDDLPQELQKFPTSDAEVAAFRGWLSANDVYYYARPRDTFDVYEGVCLARSAGYSKILLEDLS